MENYIYRLAFVTHNEVEEMTPYYFADEKSALDYAKLILSLCDNTTNNFFDECYNSKTGTQYSSCYFKECNKVRWYCYERLYKDNRVSYDKFLSVIRLPLLRLEYNII